jgi:hypothetical protein
MFNSIILDAAIGLVLVYLLLSLVCSSIREALAGLFKTRAKVLEKGIAELLKATPPAGGGAAGGGGGGAAPMSILQSFYEHPLITVLYQGDYVAAKDKLVSWLRPSSLPSYIPKGAFSMALLDLAARGPVDPATGVRALENVPLDAAAVRAGGARLGSARVQRIVLQALDVAQGDLDKARAYIEAWYDSAMDRVSGWYKRRTQLTLFVVGLILTVVADADTIRVARQLYSDPVRRDVAVAMAGNVSRDTAFRIVQTGQPNEATTLGQRAVARLDSVGLPIAWQGVRVAKFGRPTVEEWEAIWEHVKASLIGWILTAFAISLGAPFWFDTLNRIMMIRSTIKPGDSRSEQASGDKQARVDSSPPPPPPPVTPRSGVLTAASMTASTTAAPAE